jgi:hypothetical protein
MVSRREVLSGSVVGGLLGTIVAPPAPAEGAQSTTEAEALDKIVKALGGLQQEIRQQHDASSMFASDALSALREQMRPYLRSRRRFPPYFDVGYDIWVGVYDWLVATHQPIVVTTLKDGRYTLKVMQTTIILRSDVDGNYISAPYEELETGT